MSTEGPPRTDNLLGFLGCSVDNKQWHNVIGVCRYLFAASCYGKSTSTCAHSFTPFSYTEIFTKICMAVDAATLRAIIEGPSLMNKHCLEFIRAFCKTIPVESIAEQHANMSHRFRSVFVQTLVSTKQVGKLARLFRSGFLDFFDINAIVTFGQCDETIMAWLTCSPLDCLQPGARWRLRACFTPDENAMDILLTFGIASYKPEVMHGPYARLCSNFRRRVLDELLDPLGNLLNLLRGMATGKSTEEYVTSALYMCIFMHRLDCLKKLLKVYPLNLFTLPFALHWSVRSRDLAMVKFVTKQCPGQFNSHCELGFTPLMLAVFTEKLEIVKYLLKMKQIIPCMPSRHGRTAYDYAREIGHGEIERLLLQ